MKDTEDSDAFSEVEHKHIKSSRSLDYARVKSIVQFTMIYASQQKNTSILARKAPISMLSRRKTPETQQVADYKHVRRTSELVLR